ncbi:MAG: WecB/TagA/CpsF family glycosyltransferase [Promethearchaeota archaeon]
MKKEQIVRIFNIPLSVMSMREYIDYIVDILSTNKRGNNIIAVNTRKIITLQKDESLKELFEKATLLVPDGIGIVKAVRFLKGKKIERIAGSDLMQNICQLAPKKKYRLYIYGSKESVNKVAVKKLKLMYPGINIVGHCNGYLPNDKMNSLIEDINRAKPDILFVALGSPLQEKWIQKYSPRLNAKLLMGIGGTLDTISDKSKRAPMFMQRLGLEWYYRILREPKRLYYHKSLQIFLLFIFKVIKEKLNRK